MKFIYFLGLFQLFISSYSTAYSSSISGYVTDKASGEAVIGAHVNIEGSYLTKVTNTYGFFSIPISKEIFNTGKVTLVVSSIGYNKEKIIIPISSLQDVRINISLSSSTQMLDVVEVLGSSPTGQYEGGSAVITRNDIFTKSPQFIGESDVLKTIQTLPGIQGGQEGNTNLYVRGGDPGQNLILLDGVPVYNTSHLFGLFSVFNTDAIKQVNVIKGGFPAQYGGRLSSVIDINLNEGNTKKIQLKGDIGLLSSKLTVDGPINNNSSFLVAARGTSIGYFFDLLQFISSSNNKFSYNFHDLNLKYHLKINSTNKIYFSSYFGQDKNRTKSTYTDFQSNDSYNDESQLKWGNWTSVLRWNHQFKGNLFSNLTSYYSHYNLNNSFSSIKEYEENQTSLKDESLNEYSSSIEDWALKYDIDYVPNNKHQLKIGFATYYKIFTPSAYSISKNINNVDLLEPIDTTYTQDVIHTKEINFYIQDDWIISKKLSVELGIHQSIFFTDDTVYYSTQPRVKFIYLFSKKLKSTASFTTMQQNLHLISNNGTGAPTDMWLPSTKNLKPENAYQITTGFSYQLPKWEFYMDIYYKKMSNIGRFEKGNDFIGSFLRSGSANQFIEDFSNKNWEDRLIFGRGESYGVESMISKIHGKLTGSLSYTLSKSNRQFSEINEGKEFPFRYDRRHNIFLHTTYLRSERVSWHMNWTFMSGHWITVPVNSYDYQAFDLDKYQIQGYGAMDNGSIDDFSVQNNFRTPAYHRLDLFIKFKKKLKRGERAWNLGVYNAYNRKNPYMVFVRSYDKQLEQISLFTILPSISYQFKF